MPLTFIARHRLLGILILGWLLSLTILAGGRWQHGRQERRLTALDATLSKVSQQVYIVPDSDLPEDLKARAHNRDKLPPGVTEEPILDFSQATRIGDSPTAALPPEPPGAVRFDSLPLSIRARVAERLPFDVRASLTKYQGAVLYFAQESERLNNLWNSISTLSLAIGLVFSLPWLWYFLLDRLAEVSRAIRG